MINKMIVFFWARRRTSTSQSPTANCFTASGRERVQCSCCRPYREREESSWTILIAYPRVWRVIGGLEERFTQSSSLSQHWYLWRLDREWVRKRRKIQTTTTKYYYGKLLVVCIKRNRNSVIGNNVVKIFVTQNVSTRKISLMPKRFVGLPSLLRTWLCTASDMMNTWFAHNPLIVNLPGHRNQHW